MEHEPELSKSKHL